jgi:hypothetical protein
MAASHPPPVYTVGHSAHAIPEFVALLRVGGGVQEVAEPAAVPGERSPTS